MTTRKGRVIRPVDWLVQLGISLAGAGLCGAATFGEWKSITGACIVFAIGVALQVIAFLAQPNAGAKTARTQGGNDEN